MSSLDQFGTQNKFQIATRVCIIISDAVVLLVTWRVTFGVKRVADKERVNVSVTTLLLRDGTTYFGVLFVINIIDIVLCVTQIFPNVSLFSEVFTSVLLCRFFLNLRQVYTSGGDSQFLPSQMSDVRSASKFVGNLGAPLMHGPSGHGLSPSDWDSDSDSDLFLMDNDDPAMEEMNTDNDDLAFRENQERDEVLFGMIEISRVVNEPLKDGLGLSHEYLSLPSMDHDYDWF
ncbi:hypothetical protein AcW2_004547 [Taiwanofungus camphoratus]|nr:hypothetical protein AcW2_004547 [Antrodia cinnamomea]